jgi:uncharacterized protein (TIGR03437 family)
VARFRLGLVFLVYASASLAQPVIGQRAIVNAGSFAPFGTPGGGIARGSVFSLFGSGLGPASSPPLAFPLVTTLGGVSIKVSAPDGSAAVDAIPLFVSPAQINAIMPSNAPLGMVSMVVSFNNVRSNPSPVQVVNSSFGIYAISSGGFGPGVLQNFNSPTDQPVNSLAISAQLGQVITLWGTGLGPVSFADNVAPTPGSLPTPVEVFVGGKAAVVAYSSRSPCCSGTDQIVFTVPADAPAGCWTPVQVRTEKTIVSNSVTMAIGASAGSPCAEAGNPFATKFAAGGKLGWLNLFRLTVRKQPTGLTIDTTADYSSSTFRNESGGQFVYNPLYSLPPLGACTTAAARGDLFWKDPVPGVAATGAALDAGAQLNVAGLRLAANSQTASYSPLGWFQTGLTKTGNSTLKLNPGTVLAQGVGGANVGTFLANVPVPNPLTWTNRDQIPVTIDRTQPLTVNFSGVPSGHTVVVMGGYYSPAINATTMFTCTAPGSAASFTVPAYILGAVGTRRLNEHGRSAGLLIVGSMPLGNPLTISATGLDYGAALFTFLSGKVVLYQ